MGMLDSIYEKAKEHPVRVAFPEAANEKMMQAAYECARDGYIVSVLVGPAAELRALAAERGYDADVFEYADTADEALQAEIIEKFVARPDTRLKEKALARRMQDPLYYAMAMQKAGLVGVTFAGIENTTGDVLLAGQMMIGLKPDISTVSSIGISEIPGFEGGEGGLIAIGDSAVCTNPRTSRSRPARPCGRCWAASPAAPWSAIRPSAAVRASSWTRSWKRCGSRMRSAPTWPSTESFSSTPRSPRRSPRRR